MNQALVQLLLQAILGQSGGAASGATSRSSNRPRLGGSGQIAQRRDRGGASAAAHAAASAGSASSSMNNSMLGLAGRQQARAQPYRSLGTASKLPALQAEKARQEAQQQKLLEEMAAEPSGSAVQPVQGNVKVELDEPYGSEQEGTQGSAYDTAPRGEVILPEGQEDINPEFKDRLQVASGIFGSPITTTSAHQARPNRQGSYHPRKLAVDIDMSGMDDKERFRLGQSLKQAGILRFGTYDNHPNMLHVDMGDHPTAGTGGYMHNATGREFDNAPEWMRNLQKWKAQPWATADAGATGGGAGADDLPGVPYDEFARNGGEQQALLESILQPREASGLEKFLTSPGGKAIGALSLIPGLGPIFGMAAMGGENMRRERLNEPFKRLQALKLYKAANPSAKIDYEEFKNGDTIETWAVDKNTGKFVGNSPVFTAPRSTPGETQPSSHIQFWNEYERLKAAGKPEKAEEFKDTYMREQDPNWKFQFEGAAARGRTLPERAERVRTQALQYHTAVQDTIRTGELAEAMFKATGASGWEQIFANLPSTDARNLRNLATALKGNISFAKLQQMKQQSQTGAAGFGQLSIPEFEALQAYLGSLDPGADEESLRTNIARVLVQLRKTYDAVRQEYSAAAAEFNAINSLREVPGPSLESTGFEAIDFDEAIERQRKAVKDAVPKSNNNDVPVSPGVPETPLDIW